jgi:hypothetical protein
MIAINFPEEKPKIKKETNKNLVFCSIRKKWLILTPEEWVRQNIILYLSICLKFPPSLFSIEKQIDVNDQLKRIDLAIYHNSHPVMLVECKKIEHNLNQATLSQSLSYFSKINAKYLLITNGAQSFCFANQNNHLTEIFEIPKWSDIIL